MFSWNSNKIEGKSEFINFLNNNPDVLGSLIKQIEESISGSDVVLPVELINFDPEENEKIKPPEEDGYSEDDQLKAEDVSVDVEL